MRARWPGQRTDPGTIPGLCMKVRSSEFRCVCYRINILGSQLLPSSIDLVPAQAGKVTVRRSGVALAMRHRHHGLSTYGLNGQRQGDEHSCLCAFRMWHHLPCDLDCQLFCRLFNMAVVNAPVKL